MTARQPQMDDYKAAYSFYKDLSLPTIISDSESEAESSSLRVPGFKLVFTAAANSIGDFDSLPNDFPVHLQFSRIDPLYCRLVVVSSNQQLFSEKITHGYTENFRKRQKYDHVLCTLIDAYLEGVAKYPGRAFKHLESGAIRYIVEFEIEMDQKTASSNQEEVSAHLKARKNLMYYLLVYPKYWKDVGESVDVLQTLFTNDELFDVTNIQPAQLLPNLLAFQKRALAWMLNREGIAAKEGAKSSFDSSQDIFCYEKDGYKYWPVLGCWSDGELSLPFNSNTPGGILADEVTIPGLQIFELIFIDGTWQDDHGPCIDTESCIRVIALERESTTRKSSSFERYSRHHAFLDPRPMDLWSQDACAITPNLCLQRRSQIQRRNRSFSERIWYRVYYLWSPEERNSLRESRQRPVKAVWAEIRSSRLPAIEDYVVERYYLL